MDEKQRGTTRSPLGVAFEADLGKRADAALAIAMLNGFTAKGEARRISLSVSRPSLKAAELADVIAEFYPTEQAGSPPSTIGMPDGPPYSSDDPWLESTLSKRAADGTALFSTNVTRWVDTAESSVLIRNVILGVLDGNAAIVVAGPATGLARLLDLYGARPQIVAKVKHLVVAAGSFPAGQPEASIQSDVAAARRLFAEWPTPLVAVGSEVGDALAYPGSSIERDLGWSAAHPVAAAYRGLRPRPYDAPTAALAAMLYAVRPDTPYFKLSEPGTISVLDAGRTQFTPGKQGRHRYLIADPAQKEQLAALYIALVSAQPAPRPVKRSREMAAAPPPQAPAAPTEVKPK